MDVEIATTKPLAGGKSNIVLTNDPAAAVERYRRYCGDLAAQLPSTRQRSYGPSSMTIVTPGTTAGGAPVSFGTGTDVGTGMTQGKPDMGKDGQLLA